MTVYQSKGTFEAKKSTFKLDIQTTDISPDKFYISEFYNICDANRYAIVGILQTVDKNDTDFTNYPPDANLLENDISFGKLNTDYLEPGDKDIFSITTGDKIEVYIHHGIGFDPATNADDNQYIKNYKAGIYVHLAAGSPPGSTGNGNMV
ncbi:hypothetical protein IVB69_01020 [Flavobacterium sp. J49]|uniref:hypothetical protein n=1 Tax=Flavobacterium sp. J49 TaxID=2718534 RepID=UPI001594AC7C|nr:hypothetical protein [Flavobacterium sp. J49]MBF6640049.1 hypothetical protein [Flavobacterium sp. J49]NIC01294.1 hypothetical protein [Flavobacterium sp. J49]